MPFIFKDYKNWCCYFPVTKLNHSNKKKLEVERLCYSSQFGSAVHYREDIMAAES